MANLKQYAYFLKGHKLAIVENDITPENDPTSRDYGPDARVIRYKSPTESVTNGLEIEYAYSPKYHITDTSKKDTNINAYRSNEGYLEIADITSTFTNYGDLSGYNIVDGSYILLRNAGQFNGLHKTITKDSVSGTNNTIKLETKYSGINSWTSFEETVSLYYYVEALEDESDKIHIPEYLSKAVVYYVKAKVAEDQKDFKSKEYFMKEFKLMVEKKQSANIWGPRVIVPGKGSIR
jgi:hypothetical protein